MIINEEGNFDAVLAANRDAIGTIWNAWQTNWSGVVRTISSDIRQGDFGFPELNVDVQNVVRRERVRVRENRTRTGIRTEVVEKIDEESLGTRVISRALLPFCRANTITFEAVGMLPNTQVYPFFDIYLTLVVFPHLCHTHIIFYMLFYYLSNFSHSKIQIHQI